MKGSRSILILFFMTTLAWSTEYYVSPSGHDSNPGTSSKPWRTIQHAADIMLAGDTVYIKEGTYNERIIPQNSGSTGNYIIYSAYQGDKVTIEGKGITLPEWGGLFEIQNKSYIKVSGLRIINAGPYDNSAGILVYDNSSHVTIEKNYTYNTTSSGIGVWESKNIIIDGNEVELACNDGEQECITVAITDTFEIKNNHIHTGGPGTIGGEGIDAKDGSSNGKIYNNHVHHTNRLGIYIDAWDKHTYNIEVFKNIVHDCGGDGMCVVSEAGGLLENVRIYNNIAYHNKWCGFGFGHYGEPVSSRPLKDIEVINNTFYNNGEEDWTGGIYIESQDAENIVIRNNIISQNLTYQIQAEEGVPVQNFTIDHNLIDGYRGYEGEIYGVDYVEGDPKFVNPAGANFHLQENSPAIDSGSSVDAPSDDYKGNQRPIGSGYDIGAYEYGSTSEKVKDDLLGTWSNQGVYYRNSDIGSWVKMASPATKITAGDVDSDGMDDLLGIWLAQGGVWVKYSSSGSWALLSSTADWIGAGDMNGDGRCDLLGTWTGQGVYYRNSVNGQWVKMATPATQIAAGDLDGDGIDDLVGIWPGQGGVWAKYSTSGGWALLSSTAGWIGSGDMNGDGQDDLLGTWTGQGIYYRDSANGDWVKMATPATQITEGDIDGDGIDDLLGIWPAQGGVWVKYSSDGTWGRLSSTADWIAAGKMRASSSSSSEIALSAPIGGIVTGPSLLKEHEDLSNYGPWGVKFKYTEEKNIRVGSEIDEEQQIKMQAGPGESGFKCTEQRSLFPREGLKSRKREKNFRIE